MALSKTAVSEIVAKYGKDAKDTGSTQVQIALISAQIAALTEHLKANAKDNHSRRGLYVLVGKRKSLLDYLDAKDHQAYTKLISELNLRK